IEYDHGSGSRGGRAVDQGGRYRLRSKKAAAETRRQSGQQQRTVPDDGRLGPQEAEEPGREHSSGGDHPCGRRSRRLEPDQHSACGDQADCTGAAPDQTLKRITHATRSVMLRSRMMIAAMLGGWVVLSANAAA